MKKNKSINLLIIYDRSGQYNIPFVNEINKDKNIKVSALFLETNHTSKTHYDPLYRSKIIWKHPSINFKVFYSKYQFDASSKLRIFNGIDHLLNLFSILRNDIVLIHGYDKIIKILLVIICKLFNKKVLLRGETHLFSRNKNNFFIFLKFIYISFLGSIFDGAIPIGTVSKEFYKKYKWPQNKILDTVGYTVDDLKNNYDIKLDIIKHRQDQFKKRNKKIRFLYLGRLDKRKGIESLISSFSKLNNEKYELHIVGDGPLRKEIIEAKLNINFYGFVDNSKLAKYFLMADFLICPSLFEPWGLVINEAYNFGLPVLASNKVASMVDLNENDKNYIFKSNDFYDLKLKINYLINLDKDLYLKKVIRIINKINSWNNKSQVNNLKKIISRL